MGYVRVKILIGANKERAEEVEFLTDTGAFHTTLPSDLAERLGIKELARTKVTLADSREVEVSLSYAYIKALDREGVMPVAILEVPEPLLGVSTLEGLGLRVDPTTGKLEHSRPYGLAILGFSPSRL